MRANPSRLTNGMPIVLVTRGICVRSGCGDICRSRTLNICGVLSDPDLRGASLGMFTRVDQIKKPVLVLQPAK